MNLQCRNLFCVCPTSGCGLPYSIKSNLTDLRVLHILWDCRLRYPSYCVWGHPGQFNSYHWIRFFPLQGKMGSPGRVENSWFEQQGTQKEQCLGYQYDTRFRELQTSNFASRNCLFFILNSHPHNVPYVFPGDPSQFGLELFLTRLFEPFGPFGM